jgi:aminomethyltransferase
MSVEKVFARATPFHVRAAVANRDNAWTTRNGVTLSSFYDDAGDEALAARTRVAIADISWRWRAMIEGPRAGEFLSRLLTRDPAKLESGNALKALWLSDSGGVRGAAVVARFGRDSFLLASAAPDREWIGAAASSFALAPRDISETEGGLAIVGPYAHATLAACGLEADLEPLVFRKLFWRGLDVTLSRWGEHGGYEIWCKSDDGIVVWDRLMRAGATFGIVPAGLAVQDLLDIEAGIARPGRDYAPAREAFAKGPTPLALGLEKLIDDDHKSFNGRDAWLRARLMETRRLAGIEFDGDAPAPFTPLLLDNKTVGHTLTSAFLPALRRAIALAQVDVAAIQPGTALSLMLPPSLEFPDFRNATARIVSLPFLPVPNQIAP